ncbi:MAG: lipoate--protein ligase [Bacillota bacterium]|nr:lipoate--protein ligase [Bacillota bacterium]
MPKPVVVRTDRINPYQNLALEECILDSIGEDAIVLFLWQSARAVVIGRNQNVWQECDVRLLEREKILLARRISGGGTVWHDAGNLNFSFIASRGLYDAGRQMRLILSALSSLGFSGSSAGNNILSPDGRKVSGSAFTQRRNGSLHHGTLLINADIGDLVRCLNVPQNTLSGKAVPSVRSHVCNISEFIGGISIKDVADALIKSFGAEYGPPSYDHAVNESRLNELCRRNASWEWIYGRSPRFGARFDARFPWGSIELLLSVSNGVVDEAEVYSGATNESAVRSLALALKGAHFSSSALSERAAKLAKETGSDIIKDIAGWLSTLNI